MESLRTNIHPRLNAYRQAPYVIRMKVTFLYWLQVIRDDSGYWSQIETYISSHSEAQFSHSVCPECLERLYPEMGKPPDGLKR